MPVEAFETAAPGTSAAERHHGRQQQRAAARSTTVTASGSTTPSHPGDQPYFTKDKVVRNGDSVNFPPAAYVLSYGFGNWRLQPPTPITDASAANLKPTFTRRARRTRDRRHRHPPSAATSRSQLQRAELLHDAHFGGTPTRAARPRPRSRQAAGEDRLGDHRAGRRRRRAPGDRELGQARRDRPRRRSPTWSAALNAADGAGTWDYVRSPAACPPPPAGLHHHRDHLQARHGDADRRRRRPIIDETVWDNAREPIAQTFTSGNVSSHGRGEPLQVEERRTDRRHRQRRPGPVQRRPGRQAQSLLAFVEQHRRRPQATRSYLLGDFNSYTQEDPMKVFYDAGSSDLRHQGAGPVHVHVRRRVGSLDHAIAHRPLPTGSPASTSGTINSPESVAASTTARAADAGARTAPATTTRS